jgi:hypothetical protein
VNADDVVYCHDVVIVEPRELSARRTVSALSDGLRLRRAKFDGIVGDGFSGFQRGRAGVGHAIIVDGGRVAAALGSAAGYGDATFAMLSMWHYMTSTRR